MWSAGALHPLRDRSLAAAAKTRCPAAAIQTGASGESRAEPDKLYNAQIFFSFDS
jgi:hypothetical protein